MLTSLLPRPFSRSLAGRERDALCDLALALGASGPTLCAGWTVKSLIVHLLVRERRPWAALSGVVPALARSADRSASELAARDLATLVTQLRSVPLPLAVVDPLVNGMEMFIHHEDLRRAQPGWSARALSGGDERQLWLAATVLGRLQARRSGVPLVVSSGSRRAVLRSGESPVVISGPASEVLLYLCGRSSVAAVSFDGPEDRIEQLQETPLPI